MSAIQTHGDVGNGKTPGFAHASKMPTIMSDPVAAHSEPSMAGFCAPRSMFAWLSGLLLVVCSGGCNMFSNGMNAEGVRMYQQGSYQGALERFQQALYRDPNNPDAYYNLGATYHRLGTIQGQKTSLDQAESYYNQCLDRNPDHVDCHRGLAVLLTEENRGEEAFRLIEGWSQRRPSLAAPKIELARLYEEFGDRQAARERLLEAIAIDPHNARALASLGKLHEELGDYAQAMAVYQRSLWNNRLQPEVAARVAALQSAVGPQPLSPTSPPGARTVLSGTPVYQ